MVAVTDEESSSAEPFAPKTSLPSRLHWYVVFALVPTVQEAVSVALAPAVMATVPGVTKQPESGGNGNVATATVALAVTELGAALLIATEKL